MSIIEEFENKDRPGTYDCVAMLAKLSGISREEIAWTAKRLQGLMKSGKTKDEAKAIVAAESKQIRDSGGAFVS